MSTAQDLHREAMELAERASMSRIRGNTNEARQWTRTAFEKERRAALEVASDTSMEPTRSVLLRSAASLALECRELREAERLATLALSGEPPDEIADELREVLAMVYLDSEWDAFRPRFQEAS